MASLASAGDQQGVGVGDALTGLDPSGNPSLASGQVSAESTGKRKAGDEDGVASTPAALASPDAAAHKNKKQKEGETTDDVGSEITTGGVSSAAPVTAWGEDGRSELLPNNVNEHGQLCTAQCHSFHFPGGVKCSRTPIDAKTGKPATGMFCGAGPCRGGYEEWGCGGFICAECVITMEEDWEVPCSQGTLRMCYSCGEPHIDDCADCQFFLAGY